LTRLGGTVEHLGMPVDPGNLLMLGRLGDEPVMGLPGCARSPKQNGFDWVLQRLVADLPVGRRDIMLMGAGGLLKEIASRPQPRSATGLSNGSTIPISRPASAARSRPACAPSAPTSMASWSAWRTCRGSARRRSTA